MLELKIANLLVQILSLLLLIDSVIFVIKDTKSYSFNTRFRLNFLFKLLSYLVEVLFIFLIFQVIVSIKPLDTLLAYEERSILKRFIDFFTVYQIFIFIVLNLYDSLKKEILLSLLHQMDFIHPYLEKNQSIHLEIEKLKKKASYSERVTQYDDISVSDNKDYQTFFSYLENYEEHRVENPEKADEILSILSEFKVDILEKKERLDSLWNLSLIARLSIKVFNK
ncbi:hypothetical protein [Exiguobacterium acetylicum]|uniref:hypothetical protein n=1 Tax=Exiguobacterium acetylicum TaxID=41170 RepID=UPI001CA75FE4|nr:hypothetical protein [Exiguobacterium acetylicum]QZY88554.1 hypothetical protein K7G97_16590 [Exiguobacterium acetylicum]